MTADSTVSAAEVATIKESAGADAGAIRIERRPRSFRPLLSAGDAIYGGQLPLLARLQRGQRQHLLLPHRRALREGRRRPGTPTPSHTTLIGPTVGYSFPGNDYALVRYDNASLTHPGGFTVADAFVGEPVTRNGSTTGVHTGTVTALNVTVRYQGGGTVSGHDPDQRLRRAGRLRRPALRRHEGARPHLRRQRRLQDRRHDLLPARPRGRERLRRHRLLTRPGLRDAGSKSVQRGRSYVTTDPHKVAASLGVTYLIAHHAEGQAICWNVANLVVFLENTPPRAHSEGGVGQLRCERAASTR